MSREQQQKPKADSAASNQPMPGGPQAGPKQGRGAPSARQQSLGEMAGVLQKRQSGAAEQSDDARQTAQAGVAGGGAALPHADRIQAAFGDHDISGVKAHTGGDAAEANDALGAEAYASGNNVAFKQSPDLHTAAHEAAHVVQQRSGNVAGGLGAANDKHEQQADKVADKVVAGESAAELLTETAGPPKADSAAPPPGAAIQRKLVDNVKAKALAPFAEPLGKSNHPDKNPNPGLEKFSGKKHATVMFKPDGTLGDDLQPIADALRPAHGMPDEVWFEEIPKQYPGVMNKTAFSLGVGSNTSFDIADGPGTLQSYFRNVLFPLEKGGPWTASVSAGNYQRRSEDDKVSVWHNTGIGFNILSGTLSGEQQKLETQYDGSLFGKWTAKEATIKNFYTEVLGDKGESDGFLQALSATGPQGVTSWYDSARGGGFKGKVASWLDETMNKGDVQVNVLRSLQAFHKQGATNANNDMDDVIDAMHAKIHDKKTTSTNRILLENRILDSGIAKNVKVADNAVPDDADKSPGTEDANFDRMRIAGKVLARRELVPNLKHSFNPVAYAQIYPIELGKTLGDDMATAVIQEAMGAEKRTAAFLETGLNDQSLDPADPNAKTQKIDAQSNANALGSARLGAIEAIRESSQMMGTGGHAITAHVMAIQSLLGAHAKYAPGGTRMSQAIGTSANTGVAEMQNLLFKDYKAMKATAAAWQQDNNKRGIHLDSFADVMEAYSTKLDLAELRKVTNEVHIGDDKDKSIKVIQATAYTQALSQKTESNLAYKSAHDRYSADFMENLNGKFEEKLGGSKWIAIGLVAANARKELMDYRAALKGLGNMATAAGPALGVCLVALDAIISIHDWWAKAKLNKAKSKMTAEFKSMMDKGEKETLAAIQTKTKDEVEMVSRGEVRPADGMKEYADQLTAGNAGATPPKAVKMDKMKRAELDEFYTAMLTNPGEPHATTFAGYQAAIGVTGNDMWKKFEKEIDDLPSVWK